MKIRNNINRIACVGAGTIGGGWVAYFLSRGFKVIATDPGEDTERKLNTVIDDAWPMVIQLNSSIESEQQDSYRNNLTFTSDLATAVTDADFIQESAPDREQLKVELFSQIGKYAPKDCVIASSSSAFLPSSIASNCNHPERCIIGHPFAPSYMMPLVEVVGGQKTDPAVLDWAVGFYNSIGKKALLLKKEIDSYIANRLQHVVLNEAISLVENGICNFDDVDNAMRFGPGLRWAFAGPGMCYHLGGGKGGLSAMIEQFGFNASDEVRENLFQSIERQAGNRGIDELERWRDENLLQMLNGLAFDPK